MESLQVTQYPLISVGVVVAGLWIAFALSKRTGRPPLPPGPPGDPIIGHLRFFPTQDVGEHFHEWAKTYGDIMYLSCLGRDIVVLGSVEAATELLDKRGAIHSCRPRFTIYNLMGWTSTLTLLPYGKRFIKHRKMLHEFLNQHTCLDYVPIQTEEARKLVRNLIARPIEFRNYLARFATSAILRVAYGQSIESDSDPFLGMIHDVTEAVNKGGPPGNTPVDFFPWLQRLPSWFPGTYYSTHARRYRHKIDKVHSYPLELVRKQLAQGTAEHSFAQHHLTAMDSNEDDDPQHSEDVSGAAGVMYAAGADTTYSTLSTFVLLMTLHPECQRKAQEEIDTIIGPDRLPAYTDRPSLPYLECIVQETLRWYPVVTIGVPHRSIEDDVYKGYFIPKGSMILANLRGMSLDENTYADPHRFMPSRFLPKPQGNGEPHFESVWGFGRRICIGQHFANASLWMAMAHILATLDITKKKDVNGNDITPEVAFTTGIIQLPAPYECSIRPRSPAAERLVHSHFQR
ncbi:cytochrome P450 [Marasmius fiardii PR-910]|nr:cytochrome P450 [Marasmius fiardii PR-910]